MREWIGSDVKLYLPLIVFLLFPLILLPQPPVASAQLGAQLRGEEGIEIGPLTVYPSLGVTEVYTDNYFLEPDDDKRWDFITTITPGLGIQFPFGPHTFDFDYRSDFILPSRHDEYDVDHHYLRGMFTFNLPMEITASLGHSWSAESNPPTSLGDRIKRFKRNLTDFSLSYLITDLYGIRLSYSHEFVRFNKDMDSMDDYDSDRISLDFNYNIISETWLFLRGGWRSERYPEREPISTDGMEYSVWLGVRTSPNAFIVGSIGAGWSRWEWDDDRAGDPINTYTFRGDLTYQPMDELRLHLALSREIGVTTATTTDNIRYGTSRIGTSVSLDAAYEFLFGVSATARAGFSLNEFSGEGPGTVTDEDRKDRRYFVGVGLTYPIMNYFLLALNYDYVTNLSNIDAEDYDENRVTFMLALRR